MKAVSGKRFCKILGLRRSRKWKARRRRSIWSGIGIAWLAGSIPSRRGPVQLWRLEVGKVELEGRWVCRNREFIRIGDAAEEV